MSYHYKCEKCSCIIPAHLTDPSLDAVHMFLKLPDDPAKLKAIDMNTYYFVCQECKNEIKN